MAKWLGPSTERAPRARPTRAVVAAVVVAMLAGAAAVTRVAATADAPQDVPASQLPPSLQPDRDLAPPAPPGSAQAEEAVRRHRELGMRIAGLRQEAERLRARSSTLLGELRKFEVEQQLQESRAAQAEASLSLIEGDLAVLEQRLADLTAARERETPGVVARLQRLQRLGRVGYARIVWGTSSAQQLGRAARMMTHMAREDAARLVGYRHLTEQLTDAERRLATRRAEALELRASASEALEAARRAAAERRQLLARIGAERDQQLRVAEELERARQALDGAVAAYRPPAAAPAANASPAALPLGRRQRDLPWPVTGDIVRRFGRQRDPRFGTVVVRNGIDIATATGTDVQAVHPGTVAFADTFEGFGRVVIVDHGSGAFSLYGYLSRIAVSQGEPVAAGQLIGEVGEAPAGGPALYFELRVDGRPGDPLQWLKRR
jgi:septal ring factor EnvC (AmiA/AmiB activator)